VHYAVKKPAVMPL